MKHKLLSYLRCPVCKKGLTIGTRQLTCRVCRKIYPVQNGIPILIDLSALPVHLHRQIAYFEKEDESRQKGFILEPWQWRYVENFLSIGKPKPGGLIIDNATGSGYIAIELAKRGFRIIATDLTVQELATLRRVIKNLKLGDRILLVGASSESLPIRSGVADGMVANAILEHLPNEREAIQEMTRVLKPRAPLMLAMPLDLRYVWPFLWPVNIAHDRKIGHLRRYTRGKIRERFRDFYEITTYYTGSVIKICCMVMKMITKRSWWDETGERLDALFSHHAYGASNIVSILQKK
ncbi:MAG TPA: methyltransferase domain-containing protein [Patescibacteria group bacterium]|nr:methyltransferase domain-containing protein [Patescibacteria group bacterium]